MIGEVAYLVTNLGTLHALSISIVTIAIESHKI